MTHYSHRHGYATRNSCEPCDCYVCALHEPKTGAREARRTWVIAAVECIFEELERQLLEYGDTSVQRVWHALNGGPSLLGVTRGVFASLDRHGAIQPCVTSRNGRVAYAWQAVNWTTPVARDTVM